MRHPAFFHFSYVLMLAVAFIMLRIEWLNAQAGGRLPNREYRNNDPAAGTVAWRTSPVTTEARWRQFYGPKGADSMPVDRPLTALETVQMQADIRREQANNTLRSFVETAGLTQYVLMPLLLFTSIATIKTKGVKYGIVPLATGMIAAVFMLYRAYFTSLGI